MLTSLAYIFLLGLFFATLCQKLKLPRIIGMIAKGIPQLIMAGASCNDVFVIVLFSTFVTMVQRGHASLSDFIGIPVSIVLGILLGIVSGFFLASLFETTYHRRHHIRNSTKVIILLSASFLLLELETRSAPIVSMSGLLAVISMAVLLKAKCIDKVSKRLSEKFGKLWIVAELILFVLVGAAVDIRYTLRAGIPAIILIFIALFFRALGVLLCLLKTPLTLKERLFCVIAYMPKATVQAAIGSVPLSLGLPCGPIILSVAVLGIIITAPLEALGIDTTYKKLLKE